MRSMWLLIYRRFCVSHYTECSELRNTCHRANTMLNMTFNSHLPPVRVYKDPSHQQRLNDVVWNQNFARVQRPVNCVWERIGSQSHRWSLHNLTRQLQLSRLSTQRSENQGHFNDHVKILPYGGGTELLYEVSVMQNRTIHNAQPCLHAKYIKSNHHWGLHSVYLRHIVLSRRLPGSWHPDRWGIKERARSLISFITRAHLRQTEQHYNGQGKEDTLRRSKWFSEMILAFYSFGISRLFFSGLKRRICS